MKGKKVSLRWWACIDTSVVNNNFQRWWILLFYDDSRNFKIQASIVSDLWKLVEEVRYRQRCDIMTNNDLYRMPTSVGPNASTKRISKKQFSFFSNSIFQFQLWKVFGPIRRALTAIGLERLKPLSIAEKRVIQKAKPNEAKLFQQNNEGVAPQAATKTPFRLIKTRSGKNHKLSCKKYWP